MIKQALEKWLKELKAYSEKEALLERDSANEHRIRVKVYKEILAALKTLK